MKTKYQGRSYKNRVAELEEALHGIATLCSVHCFPADHPMDIPVCHKVMAVTDVVLGGGTLREAHVTVTKVSIMSGKQIEVELGTPLCCDPSSETYASM